MGSRSKIWNWVLDVRNDSYLTCWFSTPARTCLHRFRTRFRIRGIYVLKPVNNALLFPLIL